ncbi:hypothetical protein [Chromobacterium sp. IIBBL 290-4]|uniref:hypothetical protein n=1 Tax=Chromobacterium sp. IIBBL 290-4 TaxID=2953890 RepID=UPI0020B63D23|nr:hypothetical protein [Chromobacterium sp. IIBBL 290-4]UTH73026.1 hypothetical protein NKT35_15975 [Chromobacterium sp. IIBBL 290-4]
MKKILALALSCGFALAGQAATTTPVVNLESAGVIASGNTVNLYRVPSLDAAGKTHYSDVVLTLPVDKNGAIGKPMQTVKPSASPQGLQFVAGNYVGSSGAQCSVTTSALADGRQQGALSCRPSVGGFSTGLAVNWVSGPLAGHPYEVDLTKAGIDQIAGRASYSWGVINDRSGGWYYCFNTGDIVSAVQSGRQIALNVYGRGNIVKCGDVFTLSAP